MEFNGTFFAAIISFLAFVFIMNKMLYEPVRKIVNERNSLIDSNYSSANENNAKAESLSKQRDDKLSDAKDEAREKYNEVLAEYKERRSDIVKDAQNKSNDELNDAYENLNNLSNEAKESLKWKMTDLANDIVEKVLGYRSEIQNFDNDKVDEILYHRKG